MAKMTNIVLLMLLCKQFRGRDRHRFNPDWLQCLLLSSALQGMSIHLRCSNPSHTKIRVALSDEKNTRVRPIIYTMRHHY